MKVVILMLSELRVGRNNEQLIIKGGALSDDCPVIHYVRYSDVEILKC